MIINGYLKLISVVSDGMFMQYDSEMELDLDSELNRLQTDG